MGTGRRADNDDATVTEVLRRNRNVLVVFGPGSGKSTLVQNRRTSSTKTSGPGLSTAKYGQVPQTAHSRADACALRRQNLLPAAGG